jgi:hypothetical protein
LSKALKLQQENEDRKNELVVNNLEERLKELENLMEEKIQRLRVPKQTWPKLTFGLRVKLLKFLIKTNNLKKHIQI